MCVCCQGHIRFEEEGSASKVLAALKEGAGEGGVITLCEAEVEVRVLQGKTNIIPFSPLPINFNITYADCKHSIFLLLFFFQFFFSNLFFFPPQ